MWSAVNSRSILSVGNRTHGERGTAAGFLSKMLWTRKSLLGWIIQNPDQMEYTEDQGPVSTESELLLAISRAAKVLTRQIDWRQNMPEFLAELGAHTGASRVWMFRVVEQGPDHYVTEFTHEWASAPEWSNISEKRLQRQRVEVRDAPTRALYEARRRGELLQHHRNQVVGRLHREFELQHIHSMLTIPIMVDGFWWGILGFDHCDGPRKYSPGYLAALETGAVLLTNMILRERLHWEASHDHLTRLLNRRFFMRRVQKDIAKSAGGFFIMLDVDWFKSINDRYGHQAGDYALQHLARELMACVPDGAVCARMGGEEFAVWMPFFQHSESLETNEAANFAETFRTHLEQSPVAWQRRGIMMTVSAGLTHCRAGDNFETLFARADQALYLAKSRGRNQVVRA